MNVLSQRHPHLCQHEAHRTLRCIQLRRKRRPRRRARIGRSKSGASGRTRRQPRRRAVARRRVSASLHRAELRPYLVARELKVDGLASLECDAEGGGIDCIHGGERQRLARLVARNEVRKAR